MLCHMQTNYKVAQRLYENIKERRCEEIKERSDIIGVRSFKHIGVRRCLIYEYTMPQKKSVR